MGKDAEWWRGSTAATWGWRRATLLERVAVAVVAQIGDTPPQTKQISFVRPVKCLLFNQFSPHKNQGRREGKRRTNGKRENRDLPSPLGRRTGGRNWEEGGVERGAGVEVDWWSRAVVTAQEACWYKNTGAVTTSPSRPLRDHASTEITGGSRLHLLVGVRVLGLTSSSAYLFTPPALISGHHFVDPSSFVEAVA